MSRPHPPFDTFVKSLCLTTGKCKDNQIKRRNYHHSSFPGLYLFLFFFTNFCIQAFINCQINRSSHTFHFCNSKNLSSSIYFKYFCHILLLLPHQTRSTSYYSSVLSPLGQGKGNILTVVMQRLCNCQLATIPQSEIKVI